MRIVQRRGPEPDGEDRAAGGRSLRAALGLWGERGLLGSVLAFSWGVEILLLSGTAVLLAQGKFDLLALDSQKVLIYLPVWTGWTILMTFVIRSAWPRREKA